MSQGRPTFTFAGDPSAADAPSEPASGSEMAAFVPGQAAPDLAELMQSHQAHQTQISQMSSALQQISGQLGRVTGSSLGQPVFTRVWADTRLATGAKDEPVDATKGVTLAMDTAVLPLDVAAQIYDIEPEDAYACDQATNTDEVCTLAPRPAGEKPPWITSTLSNPLSLRPMGSTVSRVWSWSRWAFIRELAMTVNASAAPICPPLTLQGGYGVPVSVNIETRGSFMPSRGYSPHDRGVDLNTPFQWARALGALFWEMFGSVSSDPDVFETPYMTLPDMVSRSRIQTPVLDPMAPLCPALTVTQVLWAFMAVTQCSAYATKSQASIARYFAHLQDAYAELAPLAREDWVAVGPGEIERVLLSALQFTATVVIGRLVPDLSDVIRTSAYGCQSALKRHLTILVTSMFARGSMVSGDSRCGRGVPSRGMSWRVSAPLVAGYQPRTVPLYTTIPQAMAILPTCSFNGWDFGHVLHRKIIGAYVPTSALAPIPRGSDVAHFFHGHPTVDDDDATYHALVGSSAFELAIRNSPEVVPNDIGLDGSISAVAPGLSMLETNSLASLVSISTVCPHIVLATHQCDFEAIDKIVPKLDERGESRLGMWSRGPIPLFSTTGSTKDIRQLVVCCSEMQDRPYHPAIDPATGSSVDKAIDAHVRGALNGYSSTTSDVLRSGAGFPWAHAETAVGIDPSWMTAEAFPHPDVLVRAASYILGSQGPIVESDVTLPRSTWTIEDECDRDCYSDAYAVNRKPLIDWLGSHVDVSKSYDTKDWTFPTGVEGALIAAMMCSHASGGVACASLTSHPVVYGGLWSSVKGWAQKTLASAVARADSDGAHVPGFVKLVVGLCVHAAQLWSSSGEAVFASPCYMDLTARPHLPTMRLGQRYCPSLNAHASATKDHLGALCDVFKHPSIGASFHTDAGSMCYFAHTCAPLRVRHLNTLLQVVRSNDPAALRLTALKWLDSRVPWLRSSGEAWTFVATFSPIDFNGQMAKVVAAASFIARVVLASGDCLDHQLRTSTQLGAHDANITQLVEFDSELRTAVAAHFLKLRKIETPPSGTFRGFYLLDPDFKLDLPMTIVHRPVAY